MCSESKQRHFRLPCVSDSWGRALPGSLYVELAGPLGTLSVLPEAGLGLVHPSP